MDTLNGNDGHIGDGHCIGGLDTLKGETILLHSTLYTVSFYKALWTSGYTSQGIGWGNPLAGECVTIFSYLLTFLFIVTAELLKRVTHSPARRFPQPIPPDV